MNQKGISPIVIILIIVGVLVLGGGGYYAVKKLQKTEAQVCTQEVKQCPDGSYVSRTGPNCEFASCPEAKADETADWIKDLIAKEKGGPVSDPPALLTRCEYKNQIVYYLPPRCCDISSILYDENGNVICAPDGGFTNEGDGRCPDFFEERKNCEVIWKDSRSYP